MGKSPVRSKAFFGLTAIFAVAAGLQAASAFAGDTVYYYSSDAIHSEVVVTDQNRNVVERTYYAPYGQVLNRDLRDGPGYTGHEEDPETGLVYMQQRYYCPECGRFLSVDPVGVDPTSGGNFNRYEYANDNPYRYTDPDGRFECGNKQSCEVGTAISNGLKQAQAHYKVGSQAYTKLGNEIKFLGTANDGNKLTVTAVSDKNSTYIGMGAWDKKTGTGTLTVNLANVTNLLSFKTLRILSPQVRMKLNMRWMIATRQPQRTTMLQMNFGTRCVVCVQRLPCGRDTGSRTQCGTRGAQTVAWT